jgi:frataxin-like iron-binding protein CyaY
MISATCSATTQNEKTIYHELAEMEKSNLATIINKNSSEFEIYTRAQSLFNLNFDDFGNYVFKF